MEYGSFQAEEFGDLQRLVDGLFYDRHAIDRLDLIVQAEILDLAPDLMEIVNLLPPGYYDRQSLCDQLNSALAAHGWGAVYGTVEKPSHLRTSRMTKTPPVMVFTGGVFKLVCALTRPWARGACRSNSCKSCRARQR